MAGGMVAAGGMATGVHGTVGAGIGVAAGAVADGGVPALPSVSDWARSAVGCMRHRLQFIMRRRSITRHRQLIMLRPRLTISPLRVITHLHRTTRRPVTEGAT
jgi:hypothetical protein